MHFHKKPKSLPLKIKGENPNREAQMIGHASEEMLFKRCAKFIFNVTRRNGYSFISVWDEHFWDTRAKKGGYKMSCNPLKRFGSGGLI